MGFFGDNRFLSNFYFVDVRYDGWKYRTVEHAFQAAKTLDLERRDTIKSCRQPDLARSYGRAAHLRDGWEEMKRDVMLDLLRQKYQRPDLKERLLATGDDSLVEWNTWGDTYWGICAGHGENWLGILTMQVRDELRL